MNINDFQQQISATDYARQNLFEVTVEGIDSMKMVCKAASLPSAQIGLIEVPYQNRKIKVPGDRTFIDWSITIINDEGYSQREHLLQWQGDMAGFEDFEGSTQSPLDHHRVLTVQPLNRGGGESNHAVELRGWPSEIGAIDLSWESTDAIQEYTVNFSISWDNAGQGAGTAAASGSSGGWTPAG
jgi:hypothetical protein